MLAYLLTGLALGAASSVIPGPCGLAVISDVWTTRVYDLARSYNRERLVSPVHTIDRPPSDIRRDHENSHNHRARFFVPRRGSLAPDNGHTTIRGRRRIKSE